MKKSVLLNASTIVVGGGIQASVSFIRYLLSKETTINWHFAISRMVESELRKFDVSVSANNFLVLEKSPARNAHARAQLLNFEKSINPDLVFTFFGPAYVKFKAFHLCGVADGWTTHATRLAYSVIENKLAAFKMLMLCMYKGYWYRIADRWWVEAEVAREGLSRRYFVAKEKVAVVPNTCGDHYRPDEAIAPYIPRSEKIRCLTFSAYYPNKNLGLIPKVAHELMKKGLSDKVEFVITLPSSEPGLVTLMREARRLGVEHLIINVGKIAVKDGPALYRACDILFMPSLLETYSATYPEAMMMGLPIVTTNMDFAKNICAGAALYYPPTDPVGAAEQISRLILSKELYEQLRFKGHEQARNFLSAEEKNQKILDLVDTSIKCLSCPTNQAQ